jgi:PAS domain S-box-containing protein
VSQSLKRILDATSDGYGRWNIDSGEFNFHGDWLASLGYSRLHEPKDDTYLRELIHEDDRDCFESLLESHLAGKDSILDCELRLRSKTGEYRWFEIRGRVVRKGRSGDPTEMDCTLSDIQDRKNRQEARGMSQEQLKAIFQVAQDSIFIVDPVDFALISCNQAFENLILSSRGIRVHRGMRPEDINPEEAEFWKEFYSLVLERGAFSRDYALHSLDTVQHLFAQCLIQDGQISGICVFGHDITARKRAEEALRDSEEKFAKVFREEPSPLALTSILDHRYIEVNEAFTEATGFAREELIGKSAAELDILVKPEQRVEAIQELLRCGHIRNVEMPYRTKSAEVRQAVVSTVLIEIDGEPCMLTVSHDVTEHKQTIIALRESEERLRLAVELGRMYAFEWDPVTDQVQRSNQSEAILGIKDYGHQPTRAEFIGMIHPDDRDHYIDTVTSLAPDNANYKLVFRLIRPDGNMLWLEESGQAFPSADGKFGKVVGMATDVTEVRESERALRELSGRLISSQEEERRRIARELHDHIGQELALLCMQAQRLSTGRPDLDWATRNEAHELYRKIKDATTEISKISHGLHSSELDFLGLSVAAERLCRDFSNQCGLVIDFIPRDVPPKLEIGKSRCLYRVLQEALQNVAKHSRATRVSIELWAKDDQLILTVGDNGIGFEKDRIRFESGLGLVSMRERLNLVGGQFALSSAPGSGTRITATVQI